MLRMDGSWFAHVSQCRKWRCCCAFLASEVALRDEVWSSMVCRPKNVVIVLEIIGLCEKKTKLLNYKPSLLTNCEDAVKCDISKLWNSHKKWCISTENHHFFSHMPIILLQKTVIAVSDALTFVVWILKPELWRKPGHLHYMEHSIAADILHK